MARSSTILLGVTILLGITVITLAGTYSGGSGTVEDPFRISTVVDWQELIATSADYDKHFILLNDIDFEGMNLTPVATDTDSSIAGFQGTKFTGIFEGSGHVLRDTTLNLPSVNDVGLFGFLGIGSQIRNLGVENFNTVGQDCVGGLCGWNEGGTISKCFATGTVSGIEGIGGLCGWNSVWGTINNCYATGTVNGMGYIVGGLCGGNGGGTISNCHAAGTVNGF